MRTRQHSCWAARRWPAIIAEEIIAMALSPSWKHCSQDWSGWDFQHADGSRLEVKQSAVRQTWTAPERVQSPRFDIAPRTGYYEGAVWIPQPGRQAHLYVFALHGVADDTADHRDAAQWRFHVLPTAKLPAGKSISGNVLQELTPSLCWSELSDAVESVRKGLGNLPVQETGDR